jgi:putative tryptophan/tyrosine transport system substrate-binding protein
VHEIEAAAASAGIRLEPVLVNGLADFESAFATMAKSQTQAVIIQPLFDPHRMMIIQLAAKHRLATMFGYGESTVAGGLISYAANRAELFKRLAVMVDNILKGAKPADLPVEQATKFELVINLKTAKALVLTVPPTLLEQADEVIE